MTHHRLRRAIHVVLAIAISSVVLATAATANSSTSDVKKAPARRAAPALHLKGYGLGGPMPSLKKHFSFVTGLLTNHNAPHKAIVMKSSRVHIFFWDPTGTAFPAAYVNGMTRYFQDVAHDSGKKKNVYSLARQFGAHYHVTVPKLCLHRHDCARSWIIRDPYPGGCVPGGGFTACVSDTDMRNEIESIRTTLLPFKTGTKDISFMFLPQNVDTCFGSDCYSALAFCAYHSSFASGSGVVYANMPYVPGNGGCDVGEYPNGSLLTTPADAEASVTSHEHNEAMTDPFPGLGWFGTDLAHENGDQCAYTFQDGSVNGYLPFSQGTGVVQGAPGQLFNQVIHHHRYLLQEEWSNKGFIKSSGFTGCFQHTSRHA